MSRTPRFEALSQVLSAVQAELTPDPQAPLQRLFEKEEEEERNK